MHSSKVDPQSPERADSVASLVTIADQDDDDEVAKELLKTFADAQLVALDDVEGYERIGLPGELSYQPAPKSNGYKFDPDAGIKTFQKLPKVTEEIAREILLRYASKRCCGGEKFIRDLPIVKIETTLAWHYGLESFLEARYTCWSYEPYSGQPIDGRENGKAPGPWDVELRPAEYFVNEDTEATVPHTCTLKPCHHCLQHGCIACHRCKGKRFVKCSDCSGHGKRTVVQGAVTRRVACSGCDGQAKKRCPSCRGSGEMQCPTCKGHKRLLFAVKVKVEWRRRDGDFIEEKTDLPDELVRDVSGQTIFFEEDESVSAIQNFPLASVNEASAKLLRAHKKNYKGQRCVRQRHNLRGVPVTECHYQHAGRIGVFFIYGFENRLFVEKFPRGCGCSLL